MVWYWKSQSLVFFCVCEITVSLSERIILTRLDSLDSLKMMLAFFVSSPSRGMSAIKQHLEQKKCVLKMLCVNPSSIFLHKLLRYTVNAHQGCLVHSSRRLIPLNRQWSIRLCVSIS